MRFFLKTLFIFIFIFSSYSYNIPVTCTDEDSENFIHNNAIILMCENHKGPMDKEVLRSYRRLYRKLIEKRIPSYLAELKEKTIKDLLDKQYQSLRLYPELCTVFGHDSIYNPTDIKKSIHPYSPCFTQGDSAMSEIYLKHYKKKESFCSSSRIENEDKIKDKKIEILVNATKVAYLNDQVTKKTIQFKKLLEIIEDTPDVEKRYNGASACIHNRVFKDLRLKIEQNRDVIYNDFKKCNVFARENKSTVEALISISNSLKEINNKLNNVKARSPLFYSYESNSIVSGSLKIVETKLLKDTLDYINGPNGLALKNEVYDLIELKKDSIENNDSFKNAIDNFVSDKTVETSFKSEILNSTLAINKQMSGICKSDGKYLPLYPDLVQSYFSLEGKTTDNDFLKDETNLGELQCLSLLEAQDDLSGSTSLILGGVALTGGLLLAIPSGGTSLMAAYSVAAGAVLTGIGISETYNLANNSVTAEGLHQLTYTTIDEVLEAKEEYNIAKRLSVLDTALGFIDIGLLSKVAKASPRLKARVPPRKLSEVEKSRQTFVNSVRDRAEELKEDMLKMLSRDGPVDEETIDEIENTVAVLLKNDPKTNEITLTHLKEMSVKYSEKGIPTYIDKLKDGSLILRFDTKNIRGSSRLAKLIRRYQRMYPEYDLSEMISHNPLYTVSNNLNGFFNTNDNILDIGFNSLVSLDNDLLDTVMLHELRHASFNIKRKRGQSSIYDISYHSKEDNLQSIDDFGYTSYMSSEEIYNNKKMIRDARKNINKFLRDGDINKAKSLYDSALSRLQRIKTLQESAIKHSKSAISSSDDLIVAIKEARESGVSFEKMMNNLKDKYDFNIYPTSHDMLGVKIGIGDGKTVHTTILDESITNLISSTSPNAPIVFLNRVIEYVKNQNNSLVSHIEGQNHKLVSLEKIVTNQDSYPFSKNKDGILTLEDDIASLFDDIADLERGAKNPETSEASKTFE